MTTVMGLCFSPLPLNLLPTTFPEHYQVTTSTYDMRSIQNQAILSNY